MRAAVRDRRYKAMPDNKNANRESVVFPRFKIGPLTVLITAVASVSAFKASYRDQGLLSLFVIALAVAVAGIVMLYVERFSSDESVVRRVCGGWLVVLGVVGLLVLRLCSD